MIFIIKTEVVHRWVATLYHVEINTIFFRKYAGRVQHTPYARLWINLIVFQLRFVLLRWKYIWKKWSGPFFYISWVCSTVLFIPYTLASTKVYEAVGTQWWYTDILASPPPWVYRVITHGWSYVCAQPMRDGVTLWRRLSLARYKTKISPDYINTVLPLCNVSKVSSSDLYRF